MFELPPSKGKNQRKREDKIKEFDSSSTHSVFLDHSILEKRQKAAAMAAKKGNRA